MLIVALATGLYVGTDEPALLNGVMGGLVVGAALILLAVWQR